MGLWDGGNRISAKAGIEVRERGARVAEIRFQFFGARCIHCTLQPRKSFSMNNSKSEFVQLCLAGEVLRFGAFTLKSGRISPYFFDAGLFNRGALLGPVARHYARLIVERAGRGVMLFGPAYKGIPLAAATAVKLADDYGLDTGYAFNRKEAKDHGEGGGLVGADLRGDVVIIDDVITAGTSIRESVAAIKAAGATPHSVVIALDRQEVADDRKESAAQQVEREHGIPVHSIITLGDLIDYLETDESAGQFVAAIKEYRERYGVVA